MSRAHITPTAGPELSWLQEFIDAGVINAVDTAFAGLCAGLLPDSLSRPKRRMVILAAALASRAPQRGHVAVDLSSIAAIASVDTPLPRAREGEPQVPLIEDLAWPDPQKWAATIAKLVKDNQLTGVMRGEQASFDGEWKDLLVLRNGLVYLERYFTYEETVSKALRDLAGRRLDDPSLDLGAADALLVDMFRGGGAQLEAARHANSSSLTVIAGGPGTGKTYTLTRILAAAMLSVDPPPRIALAAPTGKAASRMKQAVDQASTELGTEVARVLEGVEASTIHRLLGYRDGIRFRHDHTNPLPYDLIVIDEVSMVSLSLMGRLVDAVGPSTRMVLVGDPHQLSSVEAGAVLGDITTNERFAKHNVVTLSVPKRFDDDSGIARLATAIRVGAPTEVRAILDDPSIPEVRRVDPTDTAELTERIIRNGVDSLQMALDNDPKAALERGGAIKMLCATRRGENGLEFWQKRIEVGVRSQTSDRHFRGRWYVGRPVIATANDYLLRLFNGDTGVIVRTDGNARAIIFPEADNREPLNPAQLGQLETWWAMTIHKSQGSEFDHTAIALPPAGSPILTRELLYTGVTRARHEVTIVADEAAIDQAVGTPIRRASGLGTMLA